MPTFAAILLLLALAAPPVAGAEPLPATLVGRAVLPARSFVAPPGDAPAGFAVAGSFAGGSPHRIDEIGSVAARSPQSPRDAPRFTGLSLPFAGQPVQGLSGIEALPDGTLLALSDNGFGARGNSPDVLLMLHRLRPDWASGRVERLETLFLRDPDKVIPFRLTLEHTAERLLTGADLDPESLQAVGELVWIGDEFGPYLVAVDRTGRVVRFVETVVDGRAVRSPDHHALGLPAEPGPVRFELRRSKGFEGMAASPDGRLLYPMFEGPVHLDGSGDGVETVGGRVALRVIEYDTAAAHFTGRQWRYPLDAPGNAIGDFQLIDATRGFVIERDNNEGEPGLRCPAEPRSDCFTAPAALKRLYLVDLGRGGLLEKLAHVDLLAIRDPDGRAGADGVGGRFTFPFITIESLAVVDERTVIVGNDNNFPFSNGRRPGRPDDNELVLLEIGELPDRRPSAPP